MKLDWSKLDSDSQFILVTLMGLTLMIGVTGLSFMGNQWANHIWPEPGLKECK